MGDWTFDCDNCGEEIRTAQCIEGTKVKCADCGHTWQVLVDDGDMPPHLDYLDGEEPQP